LGSGVGVELQIYRVSIFQAAKNGEVTQASKGAGIREKWSIPYREQAHEVQAEEGVGALEEADDADGEGRAVCVAAS
jgi:hypothetical protein